MGQLFENFMLRTGQLSTLESVVNIRIGQEYQVHAVMRTWNGLESQGI